MIKSDAEYEINYIKYKKKYLDLKTQIQMAGVVEDRSGIHTSIIVTHNARLRCLIDELFPDFMGRLIRQYNTEINHYNEDVKNHNKNNPNKRREKKSIKEIRFKNGCILEWYIKSDTSITRGYVDFHVKMVYSGRVAEKNRKPGLYFVSPNDKSKDRHPVSDIDFPEINTDVVSSKLRLYESIFGSIKEHYIYVIRHGEAEHNVGKFNLTKDTVLTSDGRNDSMQLGKELALLIHPGKGNKIYYFSSDLKRTRQTMGIIHHQLKKTPRLNLPKSVIVVPCAHELSYVSRGNCDYANINKFVPFENVNDCVRYQTQCTSACDEHATADIKKLCCCATNGLAVDWSFYNEFYKKNGKDKNSACTTTNLIHEIIRIICKLSKDIPYNHFWRGPYDILIPDNIKEVPIKINSKETLRRTDVLHRKNKKIKIKPKSTFASLPTGLEYYEEEEEDKYKQKYANPSCGEYFWKKQKI